MNLVAFFAGVSVIVGGVFAIEGFLARRTIRRRQERLWRIRMERAADQISDASV